MDGNRQLVNQKVADVLERWPETAVVFHKHNMACVGCVVAPFYSIADVTRVYGIKAETFVTELEQVISLGPETSEELNLE